MASLFRQPSASRISAGYYAEADDEVDDEDEDDGK